MEQLQQSEKIKRLLEIRDKGAEFATLEDIPLTYDIIIQFFNLNKKIQEMIKDLDFKLVINLEGIGANTFIISRGSAEYKQGKLDDADVILTTDLTTIAQILLGIKDPIIAYFRGEIEVDGDLLTMVQYQELLELSYTELKIIDVDKRELILEPSELKMLLEVYKGIIKPDDPSIMVSFLKILTAFVNNNSEALEEIEDQEMRIQLKVRDIESFLIEITDGKMNWSEGAVEDASVTIEMPMDIGMDMIQSGDAVSAYMAGDISVEGNLQEALAFQEVLQIFLDTIEMTL
ncbi:MAG: SCP2 sterol-binding domain-containing protein [Promethearchaeota archaeon]